MTIYRRVLLDTSAIVAIFQPNEKKHSTCVETLRNITTPLITSWPVLTEAHYLLHQDRNAQSALLSLAKSPALNVVTLEGDFIAWLELFSERYEDHDVQLADASLVWLAEQTRTNIVFTLDRRDFSIYRIHRDSKVEAFNILPEAPHN